MFYIRSVCFCTDFLVVFYCKIVKHILISSLAHIIFCKTYSTLFKIKLNY